MSAGYLIDCVKCGLRHDVDEQCVPACPTCAKLRAEVERLRALASAAIAFNDALRGDYVDAKPSDRVTCIVKISSLGAFVTAIDAYKEK